MIKKSYIAQKESIKCENDIPQLVQKEIKIDKLIYINMNELKKKYIVIKEGLNNKNTNIQYYNIYYNEELLNIMCQNLKLNQSCSGIKNLQRYGPKAAILPCEQNENVLIELENNIRCVRDVFLDYIISQNIPNISIENIDQIKNKNITIKLIGIKNNLCKIIRLGSKTENNINTEITDINDFNNLLMDYRYNNIKNDAYYKANIIIAFKCCIFGPEDRRVIGFSTYIKLMELQFNKAKCVSIINTNDKVLIDNNIMIL